MNKSSFKEMVIKNTEKTISHNRYKTTSFSLLKEDYLKFTEVCKKVNRTPSSILREMINLFTKSD